MAFSRGPKCHVPIDWAAVKELKVDYHVVDIQKHVFSIVLVTYLMLLNCHPAEGSFGMCYLLYSRVRVPRDGLEETPADLLSSSCV